MSVLGDRFGADPAPIAMAQSIRVVLVVLLIQGAITLIGANGASTYEPSQADVSWAGMAVMLVGLLFAVTESPLSTVPKPLSAAGQVLIACRRLAVAALATSLLVLAVTVAFGAVVASLAGLSIPAILLGIAPGGLPEASITAKILGLGVPLVAGFHLVRLALIAVLAAPIFRGMQALAPAVPHRPPRSGEAGARPARPMLP